MADRIHHDISGRRHDLGRYKVGQFFWWKPSPGSPATWNRKLALYLGRLGGIDRCLVEDGRIVDVSEIYQFHQLTWL